MDYNTDKIDWVEVTRDNEIDLIGRAAAIELGCRVETYNGIITNKNGKEEVGNYLILINNINIKIGDYITVKSIMGQIITKKEYEVQKVFYAGGDCYTHSEIYL